MTRSLALAALCSIFFAACLGEPPPSGPENSSCDETSDCDGEEICVSGRCVAQDAGDTGDGGLSDVSDATTMPDAAPKPCDGRCGGDFPHCDAAADACVKCLEAEDCAPGVCDTASGTCVGCLSSVDCANSQVCDLAAKACVTCTATEGCTDGVCDVESDSCVQCLSNSDCTAGASVCMNGTCTGCSGNPDCGHIPGKKVCDAQECVECTATSDIACDPNVCDSLNNVCTSIPRGMTPICGSCVSDAQCVSGSYCVPTQFDGVFAGNYCLELKPSTGCTKPFVAQLTTPSLDGQTGPFCALDPSIASCPAYRHALADTLCGADTSTPECGLAGKDDAACRVVDSTEKDKCTLRCNTDGNCIGSQDCVNGSCV